MLRTCCSLHQLYWNSLPGSGNSTARMLRRLKDARIAALLTFGMTKSALPVAYRVPLGLSRICALTQAFLPSNESRLAVHIKDVEAGTGALYPTWTRSLQLLAMARVPERLLLT